MKIAKKILIYTSLLLIMLFPMNAYAANASCSTVLGNGTFYRMITDFFDYMRIVAIGLVLVLSTIDFVKAIVAQNQDQLKKSAGSAITRLVLAMIIFFLPILLNLILGIVKIGELCI